LRLREVLETRDRINALLEAVVGIGSDLELDDETLVVALAAAAGAVVGRAVT
jgi:hypothetical protein